MIGLVGFRWLGEDSKIDDFDYHQPCLIIIKISKSGFFSPKIDIHQKLFLMSGSILNKIWSQSHPPVKVVSEGKNMGRSWEWEKDRLERLLGESGDGGRHQASPRVHQAKNGCHNRKPKSYQN